jgi:hypothetical protein
MGVSEQNFNQLDDCADFLHHFIWSCVSGLMQFCNGSNKGTASVQQTLCSVLSMVIVRDKLDLWL